MMRSEAEITENFDNEDKNQTKIRNGDFVKTNTGWKRVVRLPESYGLINPESGKLADSDIGRIDVDGVVAEEVENKSHFRFEAVARAENVGIEINEVERL